MAALDAVNHPVVVRGLRHDARRASARTWCSSTSTGPGSRRWSAATARSSEQQYLPLAIDVASALHYLRHVGWTHLDIKPSNIIMGAPARLIDLSVARPAQDAPRR